MCDLTEDTKFYSVKTGFSTNTIAETSEKKTCNMIKSAMYSKQGSFPSLKNGLKAYVIPNKSNKYILFKMQKFKLALRRVIYND